MQPIAKTNFQMKKGVIGKPGRPKSHPIRAALPIPTFPLNSPAAAFWIIIVWKYHML